MVDNQHKKIAGYRDLTEEEIAAMNEVKAIEATAADMLTALDVLVFDSGDPAAARWAAIARTHLETGFMYAVKAIARPDGGIGRKS